MTADRQRGNPVGPGTARVAANIRAHMAAQQVTGQMLSLRLELEGWPLSTPAISRMLRGGRRIDVDDLFAIAQALDSLPPQVLLRPLHNEHDLVNFHDAPDFEEAERLGRGEH